jgi:DNA-binding NtrC family response regulator
MEETVRPARVLVVDDEPSVRRALEVILRKKGHDVVALDSPIAATQRLAAEDFDVAMLDIRMPELSGIELLNAVKHRRPEVEVIMMTGDASVDAALAAMKAGAHDYLIKPFTEMPDDVEHVAHVVARAAERKRLKDRNRELETRLEALGTIRSGDLPPPVTGRTAPVLREVANPGDDAELLAQSYARAKDAALRNFERRYVEALMRACDNNISAAARKAGMDRSNFKRVLRKYRSDVEDDVDGETLPPEATL